VALLWAHVSVFVPPIVAIWRSMASPLTLTYCNVPCVDLCGHSVLARLLRMVLIGGSSASTIVVHVLSTVASCVVMW
jgi:hypothetical protein